MIEIGEPKLNLSRQRTYRLVIALCFVLISPVRADSSGQPSPIRETDQGVLAGILDDGIEQFRGIPYALPPVGIRRWQAPQPPAEWAGLRDASDFGPGCVQPPSPDKSIYADEPASTSEDCLTLNIWAPQQASNAPVIVWIYGGALLRGHTSSPMYDGTNFARRGVVFVSLNYRLGVLGWLAHPDLSAESPEGVSGNYGLLDQIQALQWVHENIAAFGGDEDNVTIMGESAGALSVAYLLASPKANGLFHKAIAESPNLRAFPMLDRKQYGLTSAESTGVTLAAQLGAKDLSALRAMDAYELTQASVAARFWSQGTIDGNVLPKQLIDTFDAGEQAHVPLLAGFNSGEVRSQPGLVPAAPASPAQYEAEITKRYRDLAPEFLKVYPSDDVPGSMLATMRDAIYGWAAERMVRAQTHAGQPAFLYVFDYCYPEAAAQELCAFHASELPFVFGHVGKAALLPINWPRPDGKSDQSLSDAMIDYWSGFARAGVPTGSGLPRWLPYAENEAFMHFGNGAMPGTNPIPGMFELHDDVVTRRREANQQWFLNVGVASTALPGPVQTTKKSVQE
jgi:para-nitrobenzyl esterase